MKYVLLAVAAIVVVALPAEAQRQRSSVFADLATKEFVEKATISNMFEMEAAQLPSVDKVLDAIGALLEW